MNSLHSYKTPRYPFSGYKPNLDGSYQERSSFTVWCYWHSIGAASSFLWPGSAIESPALPDFHAKESSTRVKHWWTLFWQKGGQCSTHIGLKVKQCWTLLTVKFSLTFTWRWFWLCHESPLSPFSLCRVTGKELSVWQIIHQQVTTTSVHLKNDVLQCPFSCSNEWNQEKNRRWLQRWNKLGTSGTVM